MNGELKFVKGDATLPPDEGQPRIIAHICNDAGGWGAGFVLALSARDSAPETAYRLWFGGYSGPYVPSFPLGPGKVQLVPYNETQAEGVYVANMIAQHGFTEPGKPAIRYLWLATCLNKLSVIATNMRPHASVHMPRIGCGLAGGKWGDVELLVRKFLVGHGIDVTVYDL
jgi:hypothetical protein